MERATGSFVSIVLNQLSSESENLSHMKRAAGSESHKQFTDRQNRKNSCHTDVQLQVREPFLQEKSNYEAFKCCDTLDLDH